MIRIDKVETLNKFHKNRILELWNNEYPINLKFENEDVLQNYLDGLIKPLHFFSSDDYGNITGWGTLFERENEIWFAIIVDQSFSGKKIGTHLLNRMKLEVDELSGWVIERNDYIKTNGDKYKSPIKFYLKNDFKIESNQILELPHLNAVKIKWIKKGSN